MNHQGTKVLHTALLTLRPFTVQDAPAMFAGWANDPEVTRYLSWTPHGDLEVTRALLTLWEEEAKQPNNYNWAIELAGELVGNISLLKVNDFHERAIIGYCMGKAWWGKGIMTEALKEVLRYAFEEVGFYHLEGDHAAQNIGSGRVMEKCGLRLVGTMHGSFRMHSGERGDLVIREITREDYTAQK